jgi:mannitol/fructose-specific phosphotransferase system IIA component (Ntr-type)
MSTKLGDLLSEARVILDLGATSRWEAIDEMVTKLVHTGSVKPEDRDAVIGAVRKREFSMSTGIGYGVGVPHASSELVREPVAAFGRSKKKIDFESIDGKPVGLVILFLVPRGQIQQHLHTMSGIARLMQKPELREALESAPDASTILQLIKENQGP